MEPRIHQFRGGWAVTGEGFATFSASREEALRRFWRHMPDMSLEEKADRLLEGMGLGLGHDVDGTPCTDEPTRVYSEAREPGQRERAQ